MGDIIVSQITISSPKYQQVWSLREEILRKPLGLSLKNEDLSRDQLNVILIAEYEEKVIGCVFMQPIDKDQVQLRAMAVYNEWQGMGVGKKLVLAGEAFSVQSGFQKIILHARKVAIGFYQGLGYAITSNEFNEVGIPHFMMEKNVNKS